MLVAQITDTHIRRPGDLAYGVVDTALFLKRAVAALCDLDLAPDLTVVTGDLVDGGTAEEYAHLRDLLAPLKTPVLVIPGNHDAREPLRQAFAAEGYLPSDGFLHYTIEDWPLRIVALDTLIPGETGGALCRERLLWLDQALAAAPERPTLILMHHPPFNTGIGHMDRIGLDGIPGFAAIVARYSQVERILCGHLHRAIDRRFAGTVAGTAPSTAHQVALDLAPAAPLAFTFEPPGYQLHYWREGEGLVTHTASIGEWPRLHRAGKGQMRVE
ncbi:MAG TPA: phosphodiesterase [Stellaceae bacterium]|nr:phosphodiesterase [Stellaceae bacterium]